MLLAQVGCMLMGFILYISEVQGQKNSICALKGSAVDLRCSAEHPTSSMKWYAVHWNDSKHVQKELSAGGKHVTYNMSEDGNFTLTINDLRESDENVYCCQENTDTPENCWYNGTNLQVADLQVKVIPTTEGQKVTLMCSTSCPLTENPEAYIWYKNREFLYEDWSPWYQELVSSEEAVRYSCAIKGYEDLRAPEVSVDSVTSACFSVTYAKGKMCSDQQESMQEPCSITYPREVHVQTTPEEDYVVMACKGSCPMAGNQTVYRWYWNKEPFSDCENQHITVFRSYDEFVSCAVKGHEDLHSDDICSSAVNCWINNYVSRRICALEGFSVNISSQYSHSTSSSKITKSWYKIKRPGVDGPEYVSDAGRVEYHGDMKNHHVLRINDLQKKDSAEYIFGFKHDYEKRQQPDLSGAILVVTGLKVTVAPSAVVKEGQRVTLTCSTSCPLTDDTIYTWYFNSRELNLPRNHNKHLVLRSVSWKHAGNYSCAVKALQEISSPEATLTVKGNSVVILNAVKLILLLLILPAVFLYLWMRTKKTLTPTSELSDKVQTGQNDVYENVTLSDINPATQKGPAEQRKDTRKR
ncbi:uncharacterized protein LOC121180110 isoform X2 [Toxotes jaculatrix]|uniref:uncharacterized protein LOC121180110 isoform X2 n=1 Tax=Toxotes jaculatrix TaxID=941984 RepID=UPI001B3B18B2|nr:uncharacterized protein LOC121180110 isoform X2 [Toxotes jaculatrix]